MQGTFKKDTPFQKRVELAERIRSQYKDRIPVIVEVAQSNDKKLQLNRKKFLAPADISMGAFLSEIRKQANIRSEEALFLFCGSNNGILVPTSNSISQVYDKYKDEDGFLYMVVALENTFGAWYTVKRMSFGMLDNVLTGSGKFARGLGLY